MDLCKLIGMHNDADNHNKSYMSTDEFLFKNIIIKKNL